jgi:hypothetical protein
VTEETGLALIGAVAAAAGNIYVIIKSQMATTAAARAVDHNTEVTGSQAKLTTELASKAEENYRMMQGVMAEFREQAKTDRDASLSKAVDNIWLTRERVLLARHDEVMEFLHYVLAHVRGTPPPPLSKPAPEAHGLTNLPPLDSEPKPVPARENTP